MYFIDFSFQQLVISSLDSSKDEQGALHYTLTLFPFLPKVSEQYAPLIPPLPLQTHNDHTHHNSSHSSSPILPVVPPTPP